MKSLVQRINESTLLDIKTYIKDEMQSDFARALDLLKSANSTTGLILGVNNYVENVNNPIKNAGYYLAMLFKSSGLSAHENINIIKNIIGNNDISELTAFTNTILLETDKRKKNKNLIEKFKEDLVNSSNNDKTYTENFLTNYCKGFEDVAKYIFEIRNFKKPGVSTNTNIGKGELLLQLMFGNNNDIRRTGDVYVENMVIEVKDKGRLGNSELNTNGLSKTFLDNLFSEEIFANTPQIDNNTESFFGGKSRAITGIKVFNDWWQNKPLKLNKTLNENTLDNIFKCYISAILSKYITEIDDVFVNDILNKFKNKNPFSINNNILSIKSNITEFTQLTGFIYLLGYQKRENFDYFIVFDDNLKYKIIDCEKIIGKFDNVNDYIKFTLPGNTLDSSGRSNVPMINLK